MQILLCGTVKRLFFCNECNFAMPLCYHIVIQRMQIILKDQLVCLLMKLDTHSKNMNVHDNN